MTQGTRRLFVATIAGMAALALVAGAVRPAPARAATAAITFDGHPGIGAPPPQLGPYAMIPFTPDPQPVNTQVPGVTAPVGQPPGQVGFTPALLYLHVSNWGSVNLNSNGWSNGYAGDVYYTGTLSDLAGTSLGATSMTFTLPAGTNAFYFYAVPRWPRSQDNPCPGNSMTATAQDGTTSGPISVNACSARYFGFFTDGSVHLTSITVNSSMDFAVGEFGIAQNATPLSYVALGESYSAGTGVPPYLYPSDADTCDRSASAWPETLSSNLGYYGLRFIFAACQGSKVADLTQTNPATGWPPATGEPPQETALSRDNTRLVTLSLGGNDVGFDPVLTECVEFPWCASLVGSQLDSSIAQIGAALVQAYEDISSHAPLATIIVMGYPRFFPQNPPSSCYTGIGPFYFFSSQMAWMNGEVQYLDTQIQAAVFSAQKAGVNIRYVNAYDAFNGHELCTASPDMNAAVPVNPLDPLKGVQVHSFHPNLAGNEQLAQLAEQAATAVIVPVPNVVGLPATDAVSAIRSAGLVPIPVDFVDTTCRHIGYVTGQSPPAGARIATGSPVTITVAVKPPSCL